MAHLRDIASTVHHRRPPSPGRSLRDSIEEWIEELEFDLTLSAKLWANFLLSSWPVSDMGEAVHFTVDSPQFPPLVSLRKSYQERAADPRHRAQRPASASIWRQVDRWVNEGGATGRPDNDVRDQQLASSKESTNGCAGD